MKKLPILLASVMALSAPVMKAEDQAPNRILVTSTAGSYSGYVIDYTDNISFARVDGEVLANVVIDEVGLETMTLSVTRTPECQYYKLAVIPGVTANQLTDDAVAIRYINSLPSDMVPYLYQDFDHGTLSGIQLTPESDYCIFTVGIDKYGVEASVARAEFTTPAPEIVGNPHVEVETVAATTKSFTVSFKPNEDVFTYWILAGEKGTMESQYEMFGPMFGFSNFSEMISMWGIACTGDYEYTWTDMAPSTEYEVFVAMLDANGYFAPYEVYETATATLGGHGEAAVGIEVGDYGLVDWRGEMKPALTVTYTPNEEASCYRTVIFTEEEYDADTEGCNQEVCSDPWMPGISGWFHYDAESYDYNVEPGTSIVIAAAGKNLDGEWGPVNTVRYTTPETLEGYEPEVAMKSPICQCNVAITAPAVRQGVMPKLGSQKFSKGIIRMAD